CRTCYAAHELNNEIALDKAGVNNLIPVRLLSTSFSDRSDALPGDLYPQRRRGSHRFVLANP
ncbi:MAG: hypothetical protein AAGI88_24380, partial [Pseudomonadota bacterium]